MIHRHLVLLLILFPFLPGCFQIHTVKWIGKNNDGLFVATVRVPISSENMLKKQVLDWKRDCMGVRFYGPVELYKDKKHVIEAVLGTYTNINNVYMPRAKITYEKSGGKVHYREELAVVASVDAHGRKSPNARALMLKMIKGFRMNYIMHGQGIIAGGKKSIAYSFSDKDLKDKGTLTLSLSFSPGHAKLPKFRNAEEALIFLRKKGLDAFPETRGR